MNIYIALLLVILVVLILCFVEHSINMRNMKFSLKCPKSYGVYEKRYGDQNIIVLVYNKNWYNQNKSNLPQEFEKTFYDKIVPQITLVDRFKILLGGSAKKIENSKGISPLNNIVDTIIPFVTSFSDLLTNSTISKYRLRLLYYSGDEIPNITATSNEKFMYIF